MYELLTVLRHVYLWSDSLYLACKFMLKSTLKWAVFRLKQAIFAYKIKNVKECDKIKTKKKRKEKSL